jgi:hypothetical protein
MDPCESIVHSGQVLLHPQSDVRSFVRHGVDVFSSLTVIFPIDLWSHVRRDLPTCSD